MTPGPTSVSSTLFDFLSRCGSALISVVFILSAILLFQGKAFALPSYPLLAEASLLLRASTLNSSWQESDGWSNEGTAGSALNPLFGSTSNTFFVGHTTASFIPASGIQAAAVNTPFPPGNVATTQGFYIPSSNQINIPDTGGITITLDVTPEDVSASSRIAWAYPADSLPSSGNGWVIENVPGVPSGDVIAATFDGSVFAAALYKKMTPGRQRITMVFDRTNQQVKLYRNGVNYATHSEYNNIGSVLTTADLHFGVGWQFHNIAIHNRVLSDVENARLNSALVSETCVVTPTASCDVDQDGVKDMQEIAGPNSGDANADNIADKDQVNVATVPTAGFTGYVSVTAPSDGIISNVSQQAATTLPAQDEGFTYPFGVTGYNLQVVSGDSKTMQVDYVTSEPAGSFKVRKYNSTKQTYQEISNATLTDSTIGGAHVVRVVYQVVDGGLNDEDGIANGVIVDPIGLAQVVSTGQATNTGQLANTSSNLYTTTVVAVLGVVIGVLLLRQFHGYQ